MKSRALTKRGMSILAVVAGLVIIVAWLTVARPPVQPFCQADGILDPGIPNGYGYSRDHNNGCAWTIYSPDGNPAPSSAYANADRRLIPFPGPRPSAFETLAPVLALPIAGLVLILIGIWGMWTTRPRGRSDGREPREPTVREL